MMRFFPTYDDVAKLVTSTVETMEGGEIFIYKMPAVRIEDLGEALIDTYAPEYGYDPDDIEIEVVGRRLGETFHEEIMTGRETMRAVVNETF